MFWNRLLKTAQNTKRRRNKIVMLAKSKLNSIESKISEAQINKKISHENFTTVMKKETIEN